MDGRAWFLSPVAPAPSISMGTCFCFLFSYGFPFCSDYPFVPMSENDPLVQCHFDHSALSIFPFSFGTTPTLETLRIFIPENISFVAVFLNFFFFPAALTFNRFLLRSFSIP